MTPWHLGATIHDRVVADAGENGGPMLARRSHTCLLVISAGVISFTVTLGGQQPSQALSPRTSAVGTDDAATAWLRAGKHISRFQEAVSSRRGFGSVVFNREDGGFTLYWKGAPPVDVRQRLARISRSIPVSVKSARYSVQELASEATRLAGTRVGAGGPKIVVASPRMDSSGLDLTVDLRTATSTWTAAWKRQRASHPMAQGVGALSGRVRSTVADVAVGAGSRPVVAAREYDTSPFYGGAVYRNVGNQFLCSTGWRMKSPQGAYRLVTAYHCNSMSSTSNQINTFKIGGTTAGIPIGRTINGWKSPYDFMQVYQQSYGNQIYTGAWNSAASSTLRGSETAVLNAPICLSGGFSGVICNQPIRSINDTVVYADPVGRITPLIRTDDPNGVAAAGEGDSGAPTYVTTATGVRVVSMIQGMQTGAYARECRGAPFNPIGRTCSMRIWSTSAKLIERQYGWTTE